MILYRYYCKMCPPAPGAIPKRNLHAAEAMHVILPGYPPGYPRHMWGFADYTEPLTDEEIEEYELVYGHQVEVNE